ncbi:MAG: CAP domain-containing protein [Candidatus Competibacterales bacterium]
MGAGALAQGGHGVEPGVLAPVPAVDTGQRHAVVAHYHAHYRLPETALADPSFPWDGDVVDCEPGTTAHTHQRAVLQRINFFRTLAGLPGDVVLSPLKSELSQAAALVMAANGELSHTPSADWRCYSPEAAQAAEMANLYLGIIGPQAIDGFVEDPGTFNGAVPHRRWLFYPPAREMGLGAVPPREDQWSATALWVVDDSGVRASSGGNGGINPGEIPSSAVAWPPPGYVPVDFIYPRWSFALPDADFSAAAVTVTQDGQPVDVVLEPVLDGIGDNTLVWIPDGDLPGVADNDVVFQVTIDGVVVGEQLERYRYEVVAIDPFRLEGEWVVEGPPPLDKGRPQNYSFAPLPGVERYEVRVARRSPAGEVGWYGAPTTPRGYHHLTATDFAALPTLEAVTTLVPRRHGRLEFRLWRRLMSTTTDLVLEVSTDDGHRWSLLWAAPGLSNRYESEGGFAPVVVSLADYVDQPIQLRFRLVFEQRAYVGDRLDYGVLLDDLAVADVDALVVDQAFVVTEPAFAFTPTALDGYYLQVRPELGGHWFAFGPATVVQPVPNPTAEVSSPSVASP